MEDPQLYKQLVQRYLDNTATKEELDLFFYLLQQGKLDGFLEEASLQEAKQHAAPVIPLTPGKRRRFSKLIPYVAAASLIVATVTILAVYMTRKNEAEKPVAQVTTAPQAAPGTSKATLLLSNGTLVQLGGSNQTIHDAGTEIASRNNSLV
jgi:transmembrane sensor